jgi:NAD(P)-dependent dehydrogenase (short-subunit alcohol dehydrogenase family)
VTAPRPIESVFRLDGKIALLTGASSGLGWRFAHVLHGAGATVVVAARRRDRLSSLLAELPGAVSVVADVADDIDRQHLLDATMARFGRIDVLVNNAGAVKVAKAEEEPVDEFRRIVEVNLVATFALTQLVAREMLASGGGAIVNIASVLGLVGSGRVPQASYAASKGAVVNLTRELAAQWARQRIRVNAIAPGWFLSEMTEGMLSSESGRRFIARETPMGRPGGVGELDGALLFLASEASSYVTGQILAVDGGWTAI